MAKLKLKSIYDWFGEFRFSLHYIEHSFSNKEKSYCDKCDTPFQKRSKKYHLKYKGKDKIICDKCYSSAKQKVEKKKLSLALRFEQKVNSPKSAIQSQNSKTNKKELDSGGEILPVNYSGLDSYYDAELINSATLALNGLDSCNEAQLIIYAKLAFGPLLIAMTPTGAGIVPSYGMKAMSDDWLEWSEKMQKDLFLFERKAIEYSSPKLYVIAGEGWSKFSSWYLRKNDDKKTPLQYAIKMFEEALKIEPNSDEAKTVLGTLLIERVQVRDLKRGLEILQQISNKTDDVQVLISKASRWTGNIEFNSDFDYTKFDLNQLASLGEVRKRCRHLIRKLKKDKDKTDELKEVLDHMYRVALISDAASHVMSNCGHDVDPQKYDACFNKLQKVTENIAQYSYQKNGYLSWSHDSFLSENDYRTYEKIFGRSDKIFNPVSLIE